MFFGFPVIPVIPVMQVMKVIQVMQVMQATQVMHIMQVMQVSLAYLWVDFELFSLVVLFRCNDRHICICDIFRSEFSTFRPLRSNCSDHKWSGWWSLKKTYKYQFQYPEPTQGTLWFDGLVVLEQLKWLDGEVDLKVRNAPPSFRSDIGTFPFDPSADPQINLWRIFFIISRSFFLFYRQC